VKPKHIFIDGARYMVSDNLGFQQSRGVYAVEVWNGRGDLQTTLGH
jgi:hypothetical protein